MHFHVYGRTRSKRLETIGTWQLRECAQADVRAFRADLKNGIDFKGCVTFRVAECSCPDGRRMISGRCPRHNCNAYDCQESLKNA